MARKADESRRAEARRLYAAGTSSAEIAVQLVTDRRTVQRWCEGLVRGPGPRPNPAVSNERIIEMREVEGLSYAQIASLTALGNWTSARERYRAAKGIARPDRHSHQWSQWALVTPAQDSRLAAPVWVSTTECCDSPDGRPKAQRVMNALEECPAQDDISDAGFSRYFKAKKQFKLAPLPFLEVAEP
jgi:hypothetical protein